MLLFAGLSHILLFNRSAMRASRALSPSPYAAQAKGGQQLLRQKAERAAEMKAHDQAPEGQH